MTDQDKSGGQTFRASLIQMTSGRDVAKNTAMASDLIRKAASDGAHYVQTPEVTNIMELERERLLAVTQTEADNAALRAFQNLAKSLGIWLHLGSLAIKSDKDPGRLINRSYVLAPDGSVVASYDKIHMFDVTLADGEHYAESDNYQAGSRGVTADLPWGRLGLTICYDIRFPYLHRALAHAGAVFLASPAAFTRTTGKAHWHTLLQARAIEAQSFVFAAGQTGLHEHGRKTYGHSLIVSPWGEILADGGEEIGVVTADIDTNAIEKARGRLPSLKHDRTFQITPSANEMPSAPSGANI